MSFIVEPLYVAAVLCLLIAFSEWLSRQKHFSFLGSALIVILAAAVLANLRLLPSSRNAPPLYDGIFNFIAPLAIFFLFLDVRLKDLRQAGLPMFMMFALGSVARSSARLSVIVCIAPQNHGVEKAFAVAGHVHRYLHRRERELQCRRVAIRRDEKRDALRRDQRSG